VYVPKRFEENDKGILHTMIRQYPFGTWVATSGSELFANHIPFVLDITKGEQGTLMAHVARANPVWMTFSKEAPSLVIFRGPDQYITPSWYATKQATGKAVPTWNYVAVHAYATPRVIEDKRWLLEHVAALSRQQEAREALPWAVSDAPADYIDKLLDMIVGVEMPIERLVGKAKLGQGRPLSDQLGVVSGLEARGTQGALEMAVLVTDRLPTG
jgi:transcriptional regulator